MSGHLAAAYSLRGPGAATRKARRRATKPRLRRALADRAGAHWGMLRGPEVLMSIWISGRNVGRFACLLSAVALAAPLVAGCSMTPHKAGADAGQGDGDGDDLGDTTDDGGAPDEPDLATAKKG